MTRSNSSPKPPAYSASGRDDENSVLADSSPAVNRDRHEVSGQQPLHALEEGLLSGVVHAVEQELVQNSHVRSARDARVLEEGLQLGGEAEPPRSGVVVEGLDPQPVAGEVQLMGAPVDDREGEHPRQVGDARSTPLLVGAQHGLGVRMVRHETTSRAGELPAQLGVVVQLPVEHDAGTGLLGADGLFSTLDVDDGEPPHPDGELLAHLRSPRVGPAVLDRGQHRFEQLRVAAGEPGYSAHGCSGALRRWSWGLS